MKSADQLRSALILNAVETVARQKDLSNLNPNPINTEDIDDKRSNSTLTVA